MDSHIQPTRVDPRRQALLEGRLSGRGKVRKANEMPIDLSNDSFDVLFHKFQLEQ